MPAGSNDHSPSTEPASGFIGPLTSVISYPNALGRSTSVSVSRIDPPPESSTVRCCPTVPQSAGPSVALIDGIGPYQRLNSSFSGIGSTASNASSTVIGYVREQDITTGSPMPRA